MQGVFHISNDVNHATNIENILSDVDKATQTQKHRKHKAVYAIIGAVLLLVLLIAVNEVCKAIAVNQLETNLKGQTFENMDHHYDLKLYDHENDISYTFYGSESTFVFHEDNTVTWICKYNRKQSSSPEYTEPITTTYTYKVKYKGNFIYDSAAVYVVLENGDMLDVEYDRRDTNAEKKHRPSGVNYSVLYDKDLHAPAGLKDIDTSYVSSGNTSGGYKDYTNRYQCRQCGGDGKTHDWIDEGQRCSKCGGSGWITTED